MSVELIFNAQTIDAPAGTTLFDYAEKMSIPVPTSCQKQGKCRECLVEVVEGMELLTEPTGEEEHLQENFRLSCRCKVNADAGVVRCHTLRRGSMRIETGALDLPEVDHALDPAVTRDGDRILLEGKEIAQSTEPIHGLAIDIGTTTVVVRLHNLETGELVADHSFENPQRYGGSDIMARIHYDTQNKDRFLQRTQAAYLKHTIEAFPIDPKTIYEVVVAGNSTMRDIFFRLNVYSIGQKPYQSLTEKEYLAGERDSTGITSRAKRLGLPIHPEARVYGLPLISGHVGADAAACLLAINLAHEDRTIVLMDIGTNTELVVGHKDRLLCASCPAGPAFEGGAIACGMPGLDGAIESVTLDDQGNATYNIIGQDIPEGICGSGLVEVLSELRRIDAMNALGRFENDEDRLTIDEEHQVFVSESDINELAQAKGANVAGLHIVLKNFGICMEEIDRFYLAGGFGRHIDLDAARRIGLIPDMPNEKIVRVGNAAIEGTTQALLSKPRRDELEALVKTIGHVELEKDPMFFDYFTAGCQFTQVTSDATEILDRDD